jgi:hypothetical protein
VLDQPGRRAAYPLNDGSIFLMIHFSDLARSNNCFSQTVRLDAEGFTDLFGARWRKMGPAGQASLPPSFPEPSASPE